MDVIGPYCEIMRAVLGTKDVPRERSRRRLLGEVEDNSCNLRGGEQR